jgi:hypothetical protein
LDLGIEVLKDILVAVKEVNANLGGKMDSMLSKQDAMLDKQDAMLDKQDDLLNEVKDARKDLKSYMDQRLGRIEEDIAEMKVALKTNGII